MTEQEIETAVQQAQAAIEELCLPGKMTPAEAKDFLERVIEQCQSSVEALIEENEDLEA
jgi:polyhydroxyalkanoate synthesis regulator phasin